MKVKSLNLVHWGEPTDKSWEGITVDSDNEEIPFFLKTEDGVLKCYLGGDRNNTTKESFEVKLKHPLFPLYTMEMSKMLSKYLDFHTHQFIPKTEYSPISFKSIEQLKENLWKVLSFDDKEYFIKLDVLFCFSLCVKAEDGNLKELYWEDMDFDTDKNKQFPNTKQLIWGLVDLYDFSKCDIIESL